MRPEDDALRQLEQTIDAFFETGLLNKHGYYSIHEAYEEIYEHFDASLKLFDKAECCGTTFEYHMLQPYVYCPSCRKLKMKNSHVYCNESYRLAKEVLRWLKISPDTLAKWNKQCDEPEEVRRARLEYENCLDEGKIDELHEQYVRMKYNDDDYISNMKSWWEQRRDNWIRRISQRAKDE